MKPVQIFIPLISGVALQDADRTDYLRTFCEYDSKNRQACTMACPNGVSMMFNGVATSVLQMKIKCRCPRVDGVRTCGWTYKRSLLTTGFTVSKAYRFFIIKKLDCEPLIDQFNSITCNLFDITCIDGAVFNDGCTGDPIVKCNSDGSYQPSSREGVELIMNEPQPLYQSCMTSGCECPGQCLYEHNGLTECVQCVPQQSFDERTCLAAAMDAITCPENQIKRQEQF